jgi:cysteine synthase A
MSVERRRLMSAMAAWMPQQFDNPANIEVRVSTTAQEIAHDFPEGFDALITGVGTGAAISPAARRC